MRTSPDESSAEVYARLTSRQRELFAAVREARHGVDLAAADLNLAQAILYGTLYTAVDAKVPVRLLAEELNLTPSRIYQIREQVAGHREAV